VSNPLLWLPARDQGVSSAWPRPQTGGRWRCYARNAAAEEQRRAGDLRSGVTSGGRPHRRGVGRPSASTTPGSMPTITPSSVTSPWASWRWNC